MNKFFSIGHATRVIEDFIATLKKHGITMLADVRSVPRSRRNPDYNETSLPAHLLPQGIAYTRIAELGGFRAKSKTISETTNAYWTHNAFHSYADYAMGEEFATGLKKLITLSAQHTVAFMCAEMLWWRCHRRIITDYLLSKNNNVYHIIGGEAKPAKLTSIANITPNGAIEYPAEFSAATIIATHPTQKGLTTHATENPPQNS